MARLRPHIGRLADGTRTAVYIVWSAVDRFFKDRAPESAACMAFYAIFSLFPVLLLLVIIGKLLVQGVGLEDDALELVLTFFPPAFTEFVRRNVAEAMAARGAVAGVAGLVGLAWSATSGLATLALTLNRAWMGTRPIGAIVARLRAFAVVGCLIGFLAVLLLARAALRLLPVVNSALGSPITLEALPGVHSSILVSVLVFMTLFLLYRLVPRRKVPWLPAAVGALVAAGASLAVTWAFTLYLSGGLAAYRLVYGSLGALISFLTWVYAIAITLLSGAYLGAAVASHQAHDIRARRPLLGGERQARAGET